MTRLDSPRSPLVGRRRALLEIGEAIDALHQGSGALFLLSGEPGIGKTRLAEEAEILAGEAGVRVLWGRCHEAQGRPPFWPWVEVLRSWTRDLDLAAFAATLHPDMLPVALRVAELRPHLRAAGNESPTTHVDAQRSNLFRAYTTMLQKGAAAAPLLLILDDLHWADLPSLHLLEFLVQELASLRIAVLATYRDIDMRNTASLAEIIDLLAEQAQSIAIPGLTVDEVSLFVANVTGERVGDAVADRLQRETAGNPFFLDEIVRLLRSNGLLSAPPAELPLPDGVRATIRQRLAALSTPTLQVLGAAAVAGREVDLSLLAGTLEVSPAEVLDALAPANDLGILHPVAEQPEQLRFAHALLRETLREALPATERALLHRRVGELLEARLDGSSEEILSELAHHFYEAAMYGGEAKALEYAERAGRQALLTLAYEEAADHFGRALHLSDIGGAADLQRRCELLLCLGEARSHTDAAEAATAVFHQAAALARQIGSPVLLARAATGLCDVGTGWTEFGRSDENLIAVLREALATLAPNELALRARTTARLAAELFWATPPVDTNRLSAEAIVLARSAGCAVSLVHALLGLLYCRSDPDHVDEREALIGEILRLTRGRGELAMTARVWRVGNRLQTETVPDIEAYSAELLSVVRRSRQSDDRWMITALQGLRAVIDGRLNDAEEIVMTLMNQPIRRANTLQTAGALLLQIRREQGRGAEMIGAMKSFARRTPGISKWSAVLTLLYAESGASPEARALLESITSTSLAGLHRDAARLFTLTCLAEACVLCGTAEQASLLYQSLEPYDGQSSTGGPLSYVGPVAYYLGILALAGGRHADAARHLRDAMDVAERLNARPLQARILLAQARLSRADDDTTRPQVLRHQAAEIARELGLTAILAAAKAEDQASRGNQCAGVRAGLIRSGDIWVLQYKGRTTHLRPLRGLDYLAQLLTSPERQVHVLELTASPGAQVEPDGDIATGRARAAATKAIRAAIREIAQHEPGLADILSRTIRTGAFCSYVPVAEPAIIWDLV